MGGSKSGPPAPSRTGARRRTPGFARRRGLASVRGELASVGAGIGFARRGARGVAGAVADLAAPAPVADDRGRTVSGRPRNREPYHPPRLGCPSRFRGFRTAPGRVQGGDPIHRADPAPAPSEPGRPPPVRNRAGSVRIGRRWGFLGRAASPPLLRTNPSGGAERTRAAAPNEPEPRRLGERAAALEQTRAAAPNEPERRRRTNPSRGAERTRAAAPNEPEPRRRTNPSVRLLLATLRSRAAPRAGPAAIRRRIDGRPDRQRTPGPGTPRSPRKSAVPGAGGRPGGWATRERTDSRNREGHPPRLPPAPRPEPPLVVVAP